MNTNAEVEMGGMGHWPVPSGHWSDGMTVGIPRKAGVRNSAARSPIPGGESPPGTGGSPVLPTALPPLLWSLG